MNVKTNLNGDIRRFIFESNRNPSFAAFKETVDKLYDLKSGYLIKYEDPEGDDVTISTDEELAEALSVSVPNGLLRINIIVNSTTTNKQVVNTASVLSDQTRLLPLKHVNTNTLVPEFTETTSHERILTDAAQMLSSVLFEKLFHQPEFQERFKAACHEVLTSPSFSELIKSLAAELNKPVVIEPQTVALKETEEEAEREEKAELAEFEKLEAPQDPANNAEASEPADPAQTAVVSEPTVETTVEASPESNPPVLPVTPSSAIPIVMRRNSAVEKSKDEEPKSRSPGAVFSFLSSAISSLVAPHPATSPADHHRAHPEGGDLAARNTSVDANDAEALRQDELLAMLVDMGFNDREANLKALKRTHGNLERTVERLLNWQTAQGLNKN